MNLRAIVLVAIAGLLAAGDKCPNASICATGEVFVNGKCQCKPGHIPDSDGKGCHVEEPTTTTSTTTTTVTTTLPPLPTTTTTTFPPSAPSPSPTCIPESAMPSGPADVRNGFAPSSCTDFGENRRCVKGQPSGDGVLWQANEGACWPAWAVAEQANRVPKLLGGIALQCEPGYLTDPDDTSRGCFDRFGRRYKWDGGAWREQVLSDRFSGWWLGICPTRAPKTCPTPGPSAGPSCPKMPECAAGESAPGVYGCCTVNNIGSSPWTQAVEDTLDDYIRDHGTAVVYEPADPPEVAEQKETAFVKDITARMRSKGYCVTNKSETPGGGTSDEIGVRGPANTRSDQFDIVLSQGRIRRQGYVATCRPARF